MDSIEDRLRALGIVLPVAAAPIANYVPFVLSGATLIVSGQLPLGDDGKLDPGHIGKVGGNVSIEAASAAARRCAINILAQVKGGLGNLERIRRCLRLGGFINAAPGFLQLAAVMNGASDLMVEVLGEKGRHARSTIGVAELPVGSVIEIEAAFEIAD